MNKNRRLDTTSMLVYYCRPLRTGKLIPIYIPKIGTGTGEYFFIAKYKLPSYTDVAKFFGCSLRVVEKWGSRQDWFVIRKNIGVNPRVITPSRAHRQKTK